MVYWRFSVKVPEHRKQKRIPKRDQRKVLELFFNDHLYPSEISRRTGLKVGEIIAIINRILKKK